MLRKPAPLGLRLNRNRAGPHSPLARVLAEWQKRALRVGRHDSSAYKFSISVYPVLIGMLRKPARTISHPSGGEIEVVPARTLHYHKCRHVTETCTPGWPTRFLSIPTCYPVLIGMLRKRARVISLPPIYGDALQSYIYKH